MIPFMPNTAYGRLTINSLSAHTYMFTALDIRSLYHPVAYKGENLNLPGLPGMRDYEYLIDQANHTLQGYFTPVVNSTGIEYGSRFVGWEQNMAVIRAAWLEPPTATASFTGAILTPNGATLTAKVQVRGFDTGGLEDAIRSPYVWRATLDITLPQGLFR